MNSVHLEPGYFVILFHTRLVYLSPPRFVFFYPFSLCVPVHFGFSVCLIFFFLFPRWILNVHLTGLKTFHRTTALVLLFFQRLKKKPGEAER